MLFSRSVITILFLVLCATFVTQSLQAAPTEADEPTEDLFQHQTTAYFSQRSLQFQTDLARGEYYLIWLYQGINEEVSKRQKESPGGTLEAISPDNLDLVDDSLFVFPAELEEAPLRIQYMAWEELEQKQFDHSFYKARLIKDRLIETASSEQKARMFRHDLESALRSFRDGLYADAIYQFTESIDAYGYQNVGDLYFYRGECFFAVRLVDLAADDFRNVLELNELGYNLRALKRLIIVAGDAGDKKKLEEYWNSYKAASSEPYDGEYWRVLDLTARYTYSLQEWDAAIELFSQIDETNPLYAHAKVRIGDCYLAQLDLASAEESYLQVTGIEKKKARKKVKREIRDANTKLGFLDFMNGEFERALMQFSLVDGDDAIAEKAAVMSAWSWFKLHAYEEVINSCRYVLENFPQTQFYYEITTLKAYCQEVFGESVESNDSYLHVMTAMDDRQSFQDYNYERQALMEAMADVKQIEPLLFIQGKNEYLDTYITLQRKLVSLSESISLSEAYTANPIVGEIVNERREVYSLYREHIAFGDSVTAAEDVKLSREYEDIQIELDDILREISSGIRYWTMQKSLIQREEQQEFKALVADSLNSRLMQEWKSLSRALKSLSSVKSYRGEVTDPEIMFAMAGVEAGLLDLKDRIINLRSDVGDQDVSQINSNLDHWSWFALNRHSTESAKFDDYYARKARLDEIEGYISQLNALLNERLTIPTDTLGLPESLILASEAGGEAYMAPPAPMWRPPTPPVIEMPEADESAEMDADTSAMEPGKDPGQPVEDGMAPEGGVDQVETEMTEPDADIDEDAENADDVEEPPSGEFIDEETGVDEEVQEEVTDENEADDQENVELEADPTDESAVPEEATPVEEAESAEDNTDYTPVETVDEEEDQPLEEIEDDPPADDTEGSTTEETQPVEEELPVEEDAPADEDVNQPREPDENTEGSEPSPTNDDGE